MDIIFYGGYPAPATRHYDDKAIRENSTCTTVGGIGSGMCVYAEKLEGENIAVRSSRVLKLTEVSEHEKTYIGDVDGDGIVDRFVFNLDIEGKGPGSVEFGTGSGAYTTRLPAVFRTSAGETIDLGSRVKVTHPYDSSRPTESVAAFEVSPDTRKEVGASQYLLVSVEILTGNGESLNFDQCAKR